MLQTAVDARPDMSVLVDAGWAHRAGTGTCVHGAATAEPVGADLVESGSLRAQLRPGNGCLRSASVLGEVRAPSRGAGINRASTAESIVGTDIISTSPAGALLDRCLGFIATLARRWRRRGGNGFLGAVRIAGTAYVGLAAALEAVRANLIVASIGAERRLGNGGWGGGGR